MSTRRKPSAISAPRRHGVLLLIAVLAFNLAFGAWSQPAAALGDSLDVPPGAIAICSAKGIRYLLADGTELPAEQPGDGGQDCPCCFVCVTTCSTAQATPTGLNVLALPGGRALTDRLWLAAGTPPLPRPTFPARPPGRAPPPSI
jgi:hypothetical protein